MNYSTSPSAEGSSMFFEVLKSAAHNVRARLGRLVVEDRKVVSTPHYVGITSRGVVPHLSQDNYMKRTGLQGVYIALEDFIEKASNKKAPPILSQTNLSCSSPLRDFIALPDNELLILGARRVPPVVSPWSNTQTAISIYTSVGFGQLEAADYADAIRKLKPDIVIGLGDIPFGNKPGSRRVEKMSSRTERFTKDMLFNDEVAEGRGVDHLTGKIFAPILPINHEQQSFYLDSLADEWLSSISGLAIYDASTALGLAAQLDRLPKFSLSAPETPHLVLREISFGIDLFALPFIGSATDAGIALDFNFPVRPNQPRRPLGIDMWSPEHAMDISPLVAGCECYACTKYHRAYMQHLLSAKEMLAWVLLQVHNHWVVDAFFAGVRESIAMGGFPEEVERFASAYEAVLPEKTGSGPRIRGHQYKSEGPNEAKKNGPAFQMFNSSKERITEAPTPETDVDTDAEQLVEQGFAEPAARTL